MRRSIRLTSWAATASSLPSRSCATSSPSPAPCSPRQRGARRVAAPTPARTSPRAKRHSGTDSCSTVLEVSTTSPPASWYPDPTGRYQQRYWDGAQWTEHVATDGQTGTDPLPPAAPRAAADDQVPVGYDDPNRVAQQ